MIFLAFGLQHGDPVSVPDPWLRHFGRERVYYIVSEVYVQSAHDALTAASLAQVELPLERLDSRTEAG